MDSKIWEMECEECRGDGRDWGIQCTAGGDIPVTNGDPCPSCKGSGGFNLVVEERFKPGPCECPHPQAQWRPVHNYWYRYRPLTVAEVEELVKKASLILSSPKDIVMWLGLGAKLETAEGSSVRLMPREKQG